MLGLGISSSLDGSLLYFVRRPSRKPEPEKGLDTQRQTSEIRLPRALDPQDQQRGLTKKAGNEDKQEYGPLVALVIRPPEELRGLCSLRSCRSALSRVLSSIQEGD